jgi:hypothetical protein
MGKKSQHVVVELHLRDAKGYTIPSLPAGVAGLTRITVRNKGGRPYHYAVKCSPSDPEVVFLDPFPGTANTVVVQGKIGIAIGAKDEHDERTRFDGDDGRPPKNVAINIDTLHRPTVDAAYDQEPLPAEYLRFG